MQRIERLLELEAQKSEPYLLRPHQPGDMGRVVYRHGDLDAQEYGWDERFEALVAEIAAAFIRNFDPRCERCWIAEREGEIVGSVFLVKKITLWTQSNLTAARNIYERANFRLISQQKHMSFGKELVAETWDLTL
jgi:hypothetical protein